ncbi:MAG TPA: PilZ domain-containing protein [Acidobacteriota bacterium]|nr:PilZ domain-containing protein [Acidobacteriota bacterium]
MVLTASETVVPEESAAADRRRSRRRSVRLPCALRVRGKTNPARMLDLSLEGAFVQYKDPPPRGTDISLIFQLKKDNEPIYLELKATVKYSGRFLQSFENYYGCGVHFEDPTPEQVALLEAVLNKLGQEPERKYGLE